MSIRQASRSRQIFYAVCAAIPIALAGCASDIMKTYIGHPVEAVILDYGPPTTVIDLNPGQRAYQWRKISANVVSGSTSGEVRNTGQGSRYEGTETPGYVEHRECFYTFYAYSTAGRWYVTNFRAPTLECE